MTDLAEVATAAVFLSIGWFIVALFRAVGNRIVDRVASWMLPESQPLTFRFAYLIATAASLLAPSIEKSFVVSIPAMDEAYVGRTEIEWFAPAAARAELDASLEAGYPYRAPVRFVLPLLLIALKLRFRNAEAIFWYVLSVGFMAHIVVSKALLRFTGIKRASRRWDAQQAPDERGEQGGA